ncbi:MAG: hypothetical protein E7668_02205 [Ruminococcaceae bacterium]|nr:hypothetical protein [Oscillospiraceae bacterium]
MGIKSIFKNTDTRKKILGLCYSIGAIAIFNAVIQFFVYPQMEKKMGAAAFGVALSVLSVIAIANNACGYAAGCARLLGTEKGQTNNGDYNLMLIIMGVICAVIGTVYLYTQDLLSLTSVLLYWLLSFFTMLRYYSETEFKIKADFFRYMIYYVLISVGYILGIFLFKLTDQWMLALLAGEVLCFIYAVIRSKLYRPPFFKITKHFKGIFSSISFLLFSTLLENTTLHADKIVLLAITQDGEVVTTYYIASLVGKVIAMLTTPINAIVLSYLVRYKGALTKKLWSVVVLAVAVGGAAVFAGCLLVSPIVIRILYSESYAAAMPYLVPAILGQVLYFASGVLINTLLRFKGERDQFIFNALYAVEFFVCVAVGTALGGLMGFALAVVLANGIRFAAALIKGYVGKKQLEPAANAD